MNKIVLLHMALLLVIPACTIGGPIGEGEGEGAAAGEGEGEGEGGAHDGPTLFAQQCQVCHAADATGGALAPSIANITQPYANFVVRNGHHVFGNQYPDAMAPFSTTQLSDDDVTLILDFLDAQPKPTDGAGLYERMCFNCHGANASGGRVNENVAGDSTGDLLQQIRSGQHTGNVSSTEFMPAFTTDDLSDDEANLIANFVAGL